MSILSKLFHSRKRRDVDTLPVREKMAALRSEEWNKRIPSEKERNERASRVQFIGKVTEEEKEFYLQNGRLPGIHELDLKKFQAEMNAEVFAEWCLIQLQKTIRAQSNAMEMEQLIRDTLFYARRTLVSVGPEWLALEKRMEELLDRIEGK
jgi:hypothetical protein